VDDPAGLAEVADALARADRIAVDTESDSMHSYFEKVCLLQIATEREAFLVDPLALEGRLEILAPAFADGGKRKILHGSDYDIVCLKRDFAYEIRNIFDTMVAAQFLGLPKIGLADLVADNFGESLDKRHARTNWARRPLSDSELEYSYLDVKFLIELAGILRDELVGADVLEETELEFRRLEARTPTPREFDPDSYRRIRGSKDLGDAALAILRELFILRDRQARKLDRPPFKVIANDTLVRISRAAPRSRAQLRSIKGVTAYVQRRYGDSLLKAVGRGLKRGKPPEPRPRKSKGRRLSPRQQRQMERLRDWRKSKAAARGVPNLVVLPNHAILEIVKDWPRDLDTLAGLSNVGLKRARRYGEEILGILKEKR
jgi:ribonuclease D